MSKLPTALLRSRHHGVAVVVALALIASVVSLALDSPAEAAPGWNHETLDTGISTGEGLSTIYWPPYLQHHVFNSGIESSGRVLRHGWYQPGFSNWAFETLDAGISTGTDTAYAEYSGQQHVFTHGLSPTGEDILVNGDSKLTH